MIKKSKKLSVILPAFNEQANIEKAIDSVIFFLKKKKLDYEIIVVNDGSKDKTSLIVKKESTKNRKIKLINHKSNLGYGAAVYAGLKRASGDLVFFTDSDLQFNINQLGEFLKKIDGYDAVIGYRKKRSEGFLRKINMFGWKMMIRLFLGLKIKDVDCAFKLFRRETLKKLNIKSTGATFSAELIYKIKQQNFKILELPVDHFKRKFGSATGSRLSVILRGFKELFNLYATQEKLVKSRSLYIYILASVALFLSRFLLASHSANFFDSNEYVWRTASGDLLSAIGLGHPPFHPTYLFFSYLLFHYFHLNEINSLVLTNVIFGTIAIIFAFLSVREIISSKVAWLSSIFYALLPFVYISQITILVDPTMQAFYFISLYLFALSIKNSTKWGYVLSLFSGLSLSISALSHTQIAFWALGYVAVIIICQKRWNLREIGGLILKSAILIFGASTSVFVYVFLLLKASPIQNLQINSWVEAINYLFLGNVGDRNSIDLLVASKYFLLLLSSILAFYCILGVLLNLRKNFRTVVALLVWSVLPFLLTSTYIYENLYGRAMMLGLFVFCIFAAMFVVYFKSWKIKFLLSLIVITQLLILSVPAVISYRRYPGAFKQLSEIQKNSSSGGVFISSNVSRTWQSYEGDFVNFGDVGVGADMTLEKVEKALLLSRPVYISSDAFTLPYRRYDGNYFDIRSTGIGDASSHGSMLDNLFNGKILIPYLVTPNYNLTTYTVRENFSLNDLDILDDLNAPEVIFGRIVDDGKPVSMMSANIYADRFCKSSKYDLFRFDAVFCAVREIKGTNQAENWSFTDENGWFFVPNQQEKFDLVLGPLSTSTKREGLGAHFALPGDIKISPFEKMTFLSFEDLKTAIKNETGSFYVQEKFNGKNKIFELNKFKFSLPTTDRLEAENLAGEGDKISDKNASAKAYKSYFSKDRYLISGPYIDLEKGHYELAFKIRTNTFKEENSLIEIDVNDLKSGRSYFSQTFGAEKFAGDDFITQKINFSVDDKAESVEFRVRALDEIRIDLDYLVLKKD